jgi:hypothetical protein
MALVEGACYEILAADEKLEIRQAVGAGVRHVPRIPALGGLTASAV